MPFGLIVVGLLLIVTGFQNTYTQFGSQLEKDFSGPGNFLYWIVSIGAVGALGYNKTLEPFSRAFMALIIIGIFLAKGKNGQSQGAGFFERFNSDILKGSETAALPAGGGATGSAGTSAGGDSSSGTDYSGYIKDGIAVAEVVAMAL